MATTLDLDTLNNLFDNQKKLDDVFSSIFDDDTSLNTSVSFDDQIFESSDWDTDEDSFSNDDLSFDSKGKTFFQNNRSLANIALPVLAEVAIIYYIFSLF